MVHLLMLLMMMIPLMMMMMVIGIDKDDDHTHDNTLSVSNVNILGIEKLRIPPQNRFFFDIFRVLSVIFLLNDVTTHQIYQK